MAQHSTLEDQVLNVELDHFGGYTVRLRDLPISNQGYQMPTSREQSASLHILLDNTWLEDKLTLLFLKKWACQETQLSTQEKKATSATPSVLNTRSPLFHAACLPCDMAIFINSLPPSCCFMLTWRMV